MAYLNETALFSTLTFQKKKAILFSLGENKSSIDNAIIDRIYDKSFIKCIISYKMF